MAVDFASMLLKPTQATPWDLSPDGSSNARASLKLAREKFDWERKQADENNRLERERLKAQEAKERLAAEAAKAAKLQEQRLAAYTEFTKLSGEGNVEATRAMVPLLHSLGMDIELEGEEGGLPRYRVGMDAAAAQEQEGARAAQASPYGAGETAEQSLSRLGAMGLGGETGSLLPPLGIRSSDEVEPGTGLSVADRVAATYGMPGEKTARLDPATGEPMREIEDFTGGVPKNVIDMGANAAATLHRLDPALKGMAAAYPDEQTSAAAEQIRQGLRGSGLPLGKQLEAFEKGISGPASQRNAQIGAEAQRDKFRETRDELTAVQGEQLKTTGFGRAETSFKTNTVGDSVQAIEAADMVEDLLDSGPRNHGKTVNYLMKMTGQKGSQTEGDALRTIGGGQIGSIDELFDWLHKQSGKGFSPELQDSIRDFAKLARDRAEGNAYGWLDNMGKQMENPKTHERVRAGYEEFRDAALPPWLLRQYAEDRKEARDKERDEGTGDRGKKTAELSAPGKQFDPNPVTGDFEIELEALAMENDLDPDKIAPLVKHESGGKADAVSSEGASGVLQIMPVHLRRMGIEPEEFRKLSATEQLPYVMRFFKDNGITSESSADDYALAVGASDPKWRSMPDSTVIYPKGSKEWKANKPWRPADDGDITKESMLRFYGLRGGGKGGGKDAATKLPEPKTPAEKRYLELLKKRGG